MMKIKDLTIGYKTSGRQTVIGKNIEASLNRGEFTCLLGPNGAGKSTLMRTLAGFIPPLAGSILLDGRDLSSIPQNELAKSISVVLTDKPLVGSMTAEQLVALGRSPYSGFWGRINDDDRKIIENALLKTRTFDLKDRLFESLSDGEKQRVMIAKALAQSTPVIILDEPTAYLDFPGKAEAMRLMASLAHEHDKAILLSTHDLNMALSLADKLWLIDKKYGFKCGPPRQLADSGDLQNYFESEGIRFNNKDMYFSILF